MPFNPFETFGPSPAHFGKAQAAKLDSEFHKAVLALDLKYNELKQPLYSKVLRTCKRSKCGSLQAGGAKPWN
jgi:hypothetical protein